FFFSSRRRHTRWPRDWSSDVCSSDLFALCANHHCRWGTDLFYGGRSRIAGQGSLRTAKSTRYGRDRRVASGLIWVCGRKIDIDISGVNPYPASEEQPSRPRKSGVVLMLIIVMSMALLALYANIQRWRRSQVETVIVTPAASPSSTTR